MADQPIQRNRVRIPNLPLGPLVDKDGKATPEEMTFRQGLLTLLQTIAGNEGLVAPSQNAANVTLIQAGATNTPGATPSTSYSCAFGTMLYVPSTAVFPAVPNDYFIVAMNDGTVNQAPEFKQVMLTTYP
jgi:hypothetical protein